MQSIKSPLIPEHEDTINPLGGDGAQSRLLPYSQGEKAMTLKSLNTRYVKLIRKMAVMGIGLLVATGILLSPMHWCAEASGFNRHPVESDNSIPALQGAAAITYLKEHKLYESLKTAYAAHSQQGDNSLLAPLLINKQQLAASDGAFDDLFGDSVALSGSTIVVGASHDHIGGNLYQGSAYVFNRQAGGWVEAQKLTASDGAAFDFFGHSVAVSGSTIVVGAFDDNIGGNPRQGAAYIFNREGEDWVETQKLTASDGAADLSFGWSVAFSGSTVVVGAVGDNGFQGAAYVFNRQGGSWVEAQKLTASDGAAFDEFGQSVAVSGSTIVIGAFFDNNRQGAAYVFDCQVGNWVEVQKLTASDGAVSDLFGWSIAISGSTVVVGAFGDNIGDNFAQGAAYVFNRHGGSWVEVQELTASDGRRAEEFGFSVAVSGSTIVIGAIGDNDLQGSAYVFNRQAGSWVEVQKLTPSDTGFFFGSSLAMSGSTVVVGENVGGNINQGSAYIFEP